LSNHSQPCTTAAINYTGQRFWIGRRALSGKFYLATGGLQR